VTQLDVIRMLGDVLTEIDVAVGSLLPNDPNLVRLQDLRRLLDARQLALSRQVFADNTEQFQSAVARLEAVNDDIRGSISKIDDLVTVIQNVTRFVDSVTSFMGAIGAVI
jgi:hypothetical protein